MATAEAKKPSVMVPPVCKFSSPLPAEWAKLIKVGAGWKAMTVPVANNKPAIIYFEKAKKDVPEKLAAEEYAHAEQAYRMGTVAFYAALIYQYKIGGNYCNSKLEAEAKAAGKKGLDTPAKQSWWQNA